MDSDVIDKYRKAGKIAVEPSAIDGAGYTVSCGNPEIYRVYEGNMGPVVRERMLEIGRGENTG